jgi:uncharacterized protein (TIGR03435 family)
MWNAFLLGLQMAASSLLPTTEDSPMPRDFSVSRLSIAMVFATAGLCFGQSVPAAFEFADVHVSAPSKNPMMRGGALRGGRYDVRTATMVDLISIAYDMDSDKILGGPHWLDWDRFDIIAKASPRTAQKDVGSMLQNLLENRFKLIVRKDTKPMPAFALSAGSTKTKMKQSSGPGEGTCQELPQNPAPGEVPYQVVSCRGVTMAAFAGILRSINFGSYLPDPVVDKTELPGTWDFDLKWTPRNKLPQAGSTGITLFDAVNKQLGLKLEPQKLPLPVLFVESVNQIPTPNSPGVVAKIPPPPPAEFEVATIKLSPPDARGQNGRTQNGRLDLQNFTLKQLIRLAWELNNNDEMIVGFPKSAESAHYDVTAKVVTSGSGKSEDIDNDTILLMLRNLLADRFRLKVHMEERPVTAYTMTATKQVKLRKADPLNRTNCKAGAGTNAMLNRLISCQNINMTQFAAMLEGYAPGYVRAPINDATGIEGFWDLSVNFSGIDLLPGHIFDPNTATEVSDPNGSLSLPDALQKQLGLKLNLGKRTLPVLVIDHVDNTPTEN